MCYMGNGVGGGDTRGIPKITGWLGIPRPRESAKFLLLFLLFFALYAEKVSTPHAEISNFVKTLNGENMRHFFTQPLGKFDNQTLLNSIERLSSIKFGNRTQSNLVAGGHVAPKIWEPRIKEEKKSK